MTDPVLLFHGLGRRAGSMAPMARALRAAGYAPHPVAYPSTRHPIGDLVERAVAPEVDRLLGAGAERVHFVTHSLGGVLVRAFAAARLDEGRPLPVGSRAVFLAPPHGGSEVADALHTVWPVRAVLGPALAELTTGPASVPRGLGPVRGVEAGVIAGTRRIVPFNHYFADDNDGAVSVESAFSAGGTADTVVVARTHALLMRAPDVIRLTLAFLETGRFTPDADGRL
ncbi:MAG TPA: alpha/beta fold hydrolase [Rubricoccaceae bacterium]|jgi:pimeloyl-ACP methyl ester carboxylesterase